MIAMQLGNRRRTSAELAATGRTPGDTARGADPFDMMPESAPEVVLGEWSTDKMVAILTYAAAFDRIERGPIETEAWLGQMREFDPDDVARAAKVHYGRSRFPMMPADLIRIIEDGDI